ncbi:hypothetical protein J1614_005424 [Plenodomus biglobosus]|nr:hypothetical protein J1614_005424 [Plenodomus biglobosus]
MLQKMETIAGNVKPPSLSSSWLRPFSSPSSPPPPPSVPLCNAWVRLGHWAYVVKSGSAAAAHTRCRWILVWVAVVVVLWVDGLLWPFKADLEDWHARALNAERALEHTRRDAAAAATAARLALDAAHNATAAAEAKLREIMVIHHGVRAIMGHERL